MPWARHFELHERKRRQESGAEAAEAAVALRRSARRVCSATADVGVVVSAREAKGESAC